MSLRFADPNNQSTFENWASNHRCSPDEIHLPRSEEEIVELVARVRENGGSMRVVGAGHSWSDIACTDGHLVSLNRHAGIVSVDADRGLVTVEAGTRLKDLVASLWERGFSLPNLGSVAEQSVAGVISTGTHGTGVELGNLSTLVESMRLVTADGNVLELTDGDEFFDAARVGLGSLGIISRVTLRCVPCFNLRERSYTLRFDEALDQMQRLVDTHDHVKFWWLPHTDCVQVFAADRTTADPTPPSLVHRVDESGLLRPVFAGVLGLGNRYPQAIPALNWLVEQAYFVDYERIARCDWIFNLPMPPSHLEAEFSFERDEAEDALRQIRTLLDRENIKVNFITEVRFVAGDDIWMSPAYGRASCQLGAYIGRTPRWRDYFEGVEQIARRMNARPHWGKIFFGGEEQLRAVFPRFDDFLDVRDDLDPDGLFANDFTRRILG